MRDPVCGMTVGATAHTVPGHPEYGFCSNHCLEAFTSNPEQYTQETASEESDEEDDPGEL